MQTMQFSFTSFDTGSFSAYWYCLSCDGICMSNYIIWTMAWIILAEMTDKPKTIISRSTPLGFKACRPEPAQVQTTDAA